MDNIDTRRSFVHGCQQDKNNQKEQRGRNGQEALHAKRTNTTSGFACGYAFSACNESALITLLPASLTHYSTKISRPGGRTGLPRVKEVNSKTAIQKKTANKYRHHNKLFKSNLSPKDEFNEIVIFLVQALYS